MAVMYDSYSVIGYCISDKLIHSSIHFLPSCLPIIHVLYIAHIIVQYIIPTYVANQLDLMLRISGIRHPMDAHDI